MRRARVDLTRPVLRTGSPPGEAISVGSGANSAWEAGKMRDEPFAVIECVACGSVPAGLASFEVHDGAGVTFYAVTCPRCGQLDAGGDRKLIRALLERGGTRRALRCGETQPDVEEQVACLHRWFDEEHPWR